MTVISTVTVHGLSHRCDAKQGGHRIVGLYSYGEAAVLDLPSKCCLMTVRAWPFACVGWVPSQWRCAPRERFVLVRKARALRVMALRFHVAMASYYGLNCQQ